MDIQAAGAGSQMSAPASENDTPGAMDPMEQWPSWEHHIELSMGGFHSHGGYPEKCLVYFMENVPSKMDDELGVPL